jgi:hypothetical protein
VYETILAFDLEKRELNVQRQVPVPIVYEGISFNEGYRKSRKGGEQNLARRARERAGADEIFVA